MSLGHAQCGGHLEGGLHTATNSRESRTSLSEDLEISVICRLRKGYSDRRGVFWAIADFTG